MMRRFFSGGVLCLVLFTGSTASAHDYRIGDLTIGHPYAIQTPEGARTGAGYLSVTNGGQTPDRLIEVRSGYPRTMIHRTDLRNGVASMAHVEAVEIAPGETVALEPGGMHIMFMGIEDDPFELDVKVPATLVFEQAGEIEVLLSVQPRVADAATEDHSDHGAEPGK